MDILHALLGNDIRSGLAVILNLVIIESLLSVDNAAVLATMVIDLPKEQRSRALRYGIIGAYALRGACLFFAAWIVGIWWLKPLGGLYLLYLAFGYFKSKAGSSGEADQVNKRENRIYQAIVRLIGTFWATVVLVELMDLAFSIDNVFAAVAFTDHLFLICTGVFIGILAMRFVAQAFVKLMERFAFLETAAFTVIAVLGFKLFASFYTQFYPKAPVAMFLSGEYADQFVSAFTVAAFVIPVISSLLFNYPKRNILEPVIAEPAAPVPDGH